MHFVGDAVLHPFKRVVSDGLFCATIRAFVILLLLRAATHRPLRGLLCYAYLAAYNVARSVCSTLLLDCFFCQFLQVLILALLILTLPLHEAVNLYLFLLGHTFPVHILLR